MNQLLCQRVLLVALSLLSAKSALAAISGLQQITGFSSPAFLTHAPGDNDRVFVAELGGDIKIVNLKTNTITGTFLDIPSVDAEGEGGLLGLAFHPNYFKEGETGFGKFYVNVTIDNNLPEGTSPFTTRIREYSVDPNNPNQALVGSVNEVLSFNQPQTNHNGGWIGFNPAVTEGQPQYLYIATGDGGGDHDNDAGHSTLPDASGNAQDITSNFLGKMLRIDVNTDAFPADDVRDYTVPAGNPFSGATLGDDEIWAYGLRNPFRDSFDRQTGDLWIGDVGQGQREELDLQLANSPGGENYGWRFREGTFTTNGGVGGPDLPAYTDPIFDYGRGDGDFTGETVIGGYVYRGPDPDLQGKYIFGDADQNNDNVWAFDRFNPVPTTIVDNINTELGAVFNSMGRIVSFGEDNKGNLFIVDVFGSVFRILTNNLIDGDYNADGEVDAADYTVWRDTFGSTTNLAADGSGNNVVDEADYDVWKDNFGDSAHAAGSGTSVPEPVAAVLIFPWLAWLITMRGRCQVT